MAKRCAHLVDIVGVAGSIPAASTNPFNDLAEIGRPRSWVPLPPRYQAMVFHLREARERVAGEALAKFR
jgi:hypothetical protein